MPDYELRTRAARDYNLRERWLVEIGPKPHGLPDGAMGSRSNQLVTRISMFHGTNPAALF